MRTGNLVSWVKKEGEWIEPGDVILEIETDKAVMEVEAVNKGTLAKIIVSAGTENVAVDTPIAIISQAGETDEAVLSAIAEIAGATTSQDVCIQEKQEVIDIIPRRSTVKASPLARRLADIRHIDISQIVGTGPGGRIVKNDIINASRSDEGHAERSTGISAIRYIDEDMPKMRRIIADKLTRSKREVPHFYMTLDADVTSLLSIRDEINKSGQLGNKLTVNDFIIKATALAMRDEPNVNIIWIDGRIRKFMAVDVAVAVAVDDGLFTPVIKDADKKGIVEISNEMKELADLAKKNRLTPSQYAGGSITISNLGMYGVNSFLSIINTPHSGILSIGAAKKTFTYTDDGGALERRSILTIGYAIDHRVIDGRAAALFLNALARRLSAPAVLIL
jgi:pyruvate dehydrogenase E2 component (dihydrolipoamide acetyltransferase)